MSTIVTRAGKGSALTHVEVDANFTNLNTDKIQSGNTVAALTITSATINGGTITGITDLAVADGGTGLSTLTAGYIPFGAGTSAFGSSANLFWDSANNKLGIGTSSPNSYGTLTVKGATTPLSLINDNFMNIDYYSYRTAVLHNINYVYAARGTEASRLTLSNGDNIYRIQTSGYDGTSFLTATYIDFFVDSAVSTGVMSGAIRLFTGTNGTPTERMRITSAGNVGIGTTSAGAKLTIAGEVSAGQIAGRYFGFGTTGFSFDSTTVNYYGITYTQPTSPSTTYNTVLSAFDNIKFTTAGAEAMRIDPAGNVGIGTTAPLSRLNSVASNAAAVTALTLNNSNSGFAADEAVDIDFGVGSSTAAAHGKLRVANTTATVGSNSYMSFYTRAADVLAEKMRIDSSGNVGIGTTSPVAQVGIYGAGQTTAAMSTSASLGGTLYVRDSGGAAGNGGAVIFGANQGAFASVKGLITNGASNTLGDLSFSTRNAAADSTLTERMRIDSSGNVGIGTASPVTKLDISATSNPRIRFEDTGDFEWRIGIVDNTSFGFFSSGSVTERMRIDSSGNVLVGTTGLAANGKLTVNGQSRFYESTSDATAASRFDKSSATTTTSQVFIQFTVNNQSSGSGQINANGASQAAFGSFSDERLKENIVDLPSQLSKVMTLRPVEFDYKTGGHQTGFIAQEMQKVFPDAVGEDGSEEKYLTVTGWNKTEAILVKAIQEQQTIINDLKARITTLEGK
jgi:hypothetical protein